MQAPGVIQLLLVHGVPLEHQDLCYPFQADYLRVSLPAQALLPSPLCAAHLQLFQVFAVSIKCSLQPFAWLLLPKHARASRSPLLLTNTDTLCLSFISSSPAMAAMLYLFREAEKSLKQNCTICLRDSKCLLKWVEPGKAIS